MWILECDFFEHKRVWLRPGKKYLFGRTKTEAGGFAIENKSISRKHLIIEVAAVKPGDGSKVYSRCPITVTDQSSKLGTQLDGEQIRGQSRVLQGDEHSLRLGSFEHIFHIRYQPAIFSFSFSTKEQKNKDPLVPLRARLESLDVKAIIPYVADKTTHVVASKRNTAKGLQALIHGRYIVTDAYVDAVEKAATALIHGDPESLAPLEEDFDARWPDPLQYLPTQSKEPSQRPEALFAPDSSRQTIFEGYTFVFCDQTQFETLQAPITDAGGKALIFDLQVGKTTVDEIVRFAKNAAGEKGTGEFEDHSEGRGVVVVRFRCKKGDEIWSIELGDEVSRRLNQRLIEQSGFLDAILVNDPSGLRRQLAEEGVETTDVAGAPDVAGAVPGDRQEASTTVQNMASSPAVGRARSRGLVTSKFRGFDDGFDASSLPVKKDEPESEPEKATDSPARRTREPFVIGSDVDVDSQGGAASHDVRRGKKRRSPPSDDRNEEETMDDILPAAAQMKRRRIEDESASSRNAKPTPPTQSKSAKNGSAATQAGARARKRKKETDVLETARGLRRAEDEAAQQSEDEDFQATIDGMSVAEMQRLAIVEEMPLAQRQTPATRSDARADAGSKRWDDRWNGRKNFKKFRRSGAADNEADQPRRRRGGQGVIVGLEEVGKKNFGIGEDYWINDDRAQPQQRRRKRREEAQGESERQLAGSSTQQPQSQPYATARSQARNPEEGEHVDVNVDEEDGTHHRPITRLSDKTHPSQRPVTAPSSSKRSRPGSDQQLISSPAKKQRTTTAATTASRSMGTRAETRRNERTKPAGAVDVVDISDDEDRIDEDGDEEDDDDGLRFQFKTKGKGTT